LVQKLDQLKSYAESVVQSAGFDYTITANISRYIPAVFPTTFYGNIAFPPLCYVDMTTTETGRQQLENAVSDEGFRLLMHQEKPRPGLTVRFRIVEW